MYSKILVIATRRIGDVLLTTPLFHALRNAYPQAQIDVIVLKGTGGILKGNTDISNIIETSAKPGLQEYKSIITQIWRKYELAISTLQGDRPLLYAFLASKNRVGAYHPIIKKHAWKRHFYQRVVELNDQLWHVVLQNLQFTELLNIKGSTTVVPPQSVNAKQNLTALLGFDIEATRYCVFHPYPMWKYKQLEDSVWISIGKYLIEQGCKVVISGGPDSLEVSKCEMLANNLTGATSLAGKTQFADTAELLKYAQMYIGPDTSITHLAAACGTPTLAIFGPTNPARWGAWPRGFSKSEVQQSERLKKMYTPYKKVEEIQNIGNVWLYQPKRHCIPCQQEGCDNHLNSKSLCLTEISSETMIALIKSIGNDKLSHH